ncbi:hypothetical protein ASPZODRAFT_142309 [Penicilliopsis zonata CBS 506.65]|uniref:Uncharacterized protein n=1 Tax=Penicilliopsis zonata CBS 506.65 TaxID=1073090 RepID=A0A1L9SGV3_9EURO|nr:hypothetical protein ASPZODRAFT_142309 [Penicilliopsis zonata CBS 506.65]OJJ46495.1 hypothetical protein ASPZODRAFT_142309 [Penicilliopsis zonata CBS 506.65]
MFKNRNRAWKKVPTTPEQWEAAAKLMKIRRQTVHKRFDLNSGSKLTKGEYLLLKVLWKTKNTKDISALDLGLYLTTARQLLGDNAEFQAFIQGIDGMKNGDGGEMSNMGAFKIPFSQIKEVLRLLDIPKPKTCTKNDGAGRRIRETHLLEGVNEDLVNMAAISLLTAINLENVNGPAGWSPHRAPFFANFKRATMEAQVDGFFWAGNSTKTSILLEAKAGQRARHEPAVSIQEAAEVVAWLMANPPIKPAANRAFLVSSDGSEWFLSLANYTPVYQEYMLGERNTLPREEFLVMDQYGPWETREIGELRSFLEIMLAIMLRAREEAEEPESASSSS